MRKNSLKKLGMLVLAVVILITSIMTVSALELPFDPIEPDVVDPDVKSGVCGVGYQLTWSFNTKTGVLTVFGNGEMKDRTASDKLPWKSYISGVKTVVIFPGVTKVGSYAFYGCTAATSVIFCGTAEQWNAVQKGTAYLPSSVSSVKLHNFTEDTCPECGFVCAHENETGDRCSVCGTVLKKVILGDVSGDGLVTNSDVLEIFRYIYNPTLYPIDVTVGDVNKDGIVTNADVLEIFRYIYNPTLYPLG